MDEDRQKKKLEAGVLAPLYGWNAATLPAATMGVAKNSSNLYKKGVKQVSKEMAENLAKKKATKKIAKIGAKIGAKHLAGLAPAATGIGAVAVPLVEGALVLDDIRDLYNMAHDDEFKEGITYLAKDAYNGVKNFITKNPKETIAAAVSPLGYAAYKTAKKALSKDKPYAIAIMKDGRTKYSDGSIK